MAFKIEEKLTLKEKDRRAKEYQTWLNENGYTTDHHKTLLEVRGLMQELIKGLANQEKDSTATRKLAAHIETLLQSIQ